jgi:hypothetical protein
MSNYSSSKVAENVAKTSERAALDENCLPLGVLAVADEPFGPRAINRAVWALLFLGLAARLIRYSLQFPIWQDEAYLAMNYLDRGYLGLTGTLDCHQVCPLLFLWTEYTLVKLLGFSVAALRLLPFVCGVASLFLFKHLATRLLRGTALLFAVGIFATSYPLVRYSCEAKPYGCDMFFSLAMLTIAVEWWLSRDTRWLWGLAALVPLALGFSFPCVFAAGGISLAIALVLLCDRNQKGWRPWFVYNVALLGGFGLLYALNMRSQAAGELEWMRNYWQNVFPPLDSAVGFVKWLAVVHTSELLQYPVGGARGASILTAICCAAALAVLWRRGHYILAAFCLAPFLPNFVAACMWRYPYGGHVRFALYLAPAICLLAGLGAAVLLVRRGKDGAVRGRAASVVLVSLLAVIAGSSIARDFVFPYRTTSVRNHRDFARWFWQTHDGDTPMVCWERDIEGGAISPVPRHHIAALYLCNRAIYSRRPGQRQTLIASRAWRCVRFSSLNPDKTKNLCGSEADDEAFGDWLESMRADYNLVAEQKHELPMTASRRHAKPEYFDTVTVYVFAPK